MQHNQFDPPAPPFPTGAVKKGRASTLLRLWWAAPFTAIHLLPLAAVYTGASPAVWIVCIALYWTRMFAVTAGYHRYFSHRTFKTGRLAQFVLAFLAETSVQKGVLWWASHHRHHHRHSDQPGDTHSAKQDGLFHSHVGWMFCEEWRYSEKCPGVQDLERYPELVWLDRHWLFPPFVLALSVTLIWGWSGLFIGFMLSTVLLWHGTFTINSLSHLFGTQRYDSGDDSRNNWFLAALTLGEGWHNNHHYYQSSCRQGFRWWEVDPTYYVLRFFGWFGIVWDIREPPARVVDAPRPSTRFR